MTKETIPDKFLYLPILILGIYFLFRLFNQSKIVYIFPLDKFNDWASYMAQLFFLKTCGFHNICEYWYNGFVTFQAAQPGWYFFAYPIYFITNNVQLTAYLSLIITFLLSFIVLYLFREKLGLSKIKVLAFFLFLFGNAIAVGNYIRVGKIHELFGWFNLIVIFIFLIYYKDKKLDKNFLFITPFYFFAILSHQNSAVISSIALLGLFLIKKFKEKLIIILIVLVNLLATSFWWIDYVKNFFNSTASLIIVGNTLMRINKATLNDNLAAFLVPIMFFVTLYFYLKSSDNRKREFIFLLPITLIAFLLLTRLILFVPFINHVFPDSYNVFLLFFTIFMFFNLDFNLLSKYKKLIFVGLILISLASVLLNIVFTSNFIMHTQLEEETLSILPYVDDKYVILATPLRRTSYPNAYYSYGAIYHNLSTSFGWYPSAVSPNYINKLENLDNLIKSKKCNELKNELTELKTSQVISFDLHCGFLEECGFNKKINKSRVCLYSL